MTLIDSLESDSDDVPVEMRKRLLKLCEWSRDALALVHDVVGGDSISFPMQEEAERLLEEIEE
jgi:hypothetical protein